MMLAQLSVWVLAATLGQQAPGEAGAAWLKAVPGDVDVAVRGRGLEAAYGDLIAMLKAMSPRAAEAADPGLSQAIAQIRAMHGEVAVKTPWAAVGRVEPPAGGGPPPFAVLVLKDDYEGILKALAGGKDVARRPQDGGFDAIDGPHGGDLYAFKGAGFTALGPDKDLIASIAKPAGEALDAKMTPALAKPFLSGDAGIYVNADRLASRYADRIDQARQSLMAALDQAAKQAPNGQAMEAAKDMYGGLFDSIKEARALALGLDVGATGLRLSGQLDLKPGGAPAASVAAKTGPAGLDRLPAGSVFYIYMNMDAKTLAKWQNMSLRMVDPSGKGSPELAEAMKKFDALGPIEALGAASFDKGMGMFNVTETGDGKAYLEATEAFLKAMRSPDNPANFYKEVKVERDAQKHQGMAFTHISATIDEEKLAKLGTPNGAGSFKAMFGGDSIHSWVGGDGRRSFQIMAPTWDDARARLDEYLKGERNVGAAPAFKAVRSELAEAASLEALASAQGFVKMFAAQLAATANRPEIKDLPDLPKEPAFVGLSATPTAPRGFEFRLTVPAAVGPVFEKGLLPVFQALQGARPAQ
jgi:hypothetical protein